MVLIVKRMLNVPMHIVKKYKLEAFNFFQTWMASPLMLDFGDHIYVKKFYFATQY